MKSHKPVALYLTEPTRRMQFLHFFENHMLVMVIAKAAKKGLYFTLCCIGGNAEEIMNTNVLYLAKYLNTSGSEGT